MSKRGEADDGEGRSRKGELGKEGKEGIDEPWYFLIPSLFPAEFRLFLEDPPPFLVDASTDEVEKERSVEEVEATTREQKENMAVLGRRDSNGS